MKKINKKDVGKIIKDNGKRGLVQIGVAIVTAIVIKILGGDGSNS